jgi:hypothetical protein
MSKTEIVYLLTNPAMPNLIKIGKTTRRDVNARMRELYTTGVPLPFECLYAKEVEDCTELEKALHIGYGKDRINPRREFFELEPEQPLAILKVFPGTDVTPEIQEQLNYSVSEAEKESAKRAKRKSRPPLNYTELGIPIGSTLSFEDGTEVVVAEARKVEYKDEVQSLTKVTQTLLNLDYSVRPTLRWYYQGRSLYDLYNEVHAVVVED